MRYQLLCLLSTVAMLLPACTTESDSGDSEPDTTAGAPPQSDDVGSGAEDSGHTGGGDVALAEELATQEPDTATPLEDTWLPPVDTIQAPEEIWEQPEEVFTPEEDVQQEEDVGQVAEVATSAGACDNPADLATLESTADLSGKIAGCAMQCIGQGVPCMSGCVQDATGLSEGCSGCFGEAIQCTMSSCMLQCIDSGSPACADCQQQKCAPAFEQCAGAPTS